jgi:hypothetical protein
MSSTVQRTLISNPEQYSCPCCCIYFSKSFGLKRHIQRLHGWRIKSGFDRFRKNGPRLRMADLEKMSTKQAVDEAIHGCPAPDFVDLWLSLVADPAELKPCVNDDEFSQKLKPAPVNDKTLPRDFAVLDQFQRPLAVAPDLAFMNAHFAVGLPTFGARGRKWARSCSRSCSSSGRVRSLKIRRVKAESPYPRSQSKESSRDSPHSFSGVSLGSSVAVSRILKNCGGLEEYEMGAEISHGGYEDVESPNMPYLEVPSITFPPLTRESAAVFANLIAASSRPNFSAISDTFTAITGISFVPCLQFTFDAVVAALREAARTAILEDAAMSHQRVL